MSSGQRNWQSLSSSADGAKLAASDQSGYVYTSSDSGATWTEQAGSGLMYRNSIASSADGTNLVTANLYGSIYTSSDSGASWTERPGAGSRYWNSVASSADGTKLVAGVTYGGYIYTSSDSGQTWTERTSVGLGFWASIASSADGTKIMAAGGGWGSSLYASTDSGTTWTERVPDDRWSFISVASSADGTKLIAAQDEGSLYASINSGATWAEHTIIGASYWFSVTSSADSTKLAAVQRGGSIYTSSDSGVTWTQRASAGARWWNSISSSADGTKLVATDQYGNDGTGGYIYTSSDSGATWAQRASAGSREWVSISSSADGTKLVAADSTYEVGAYTGSVYTSSDSGATWTQRAGAGLRDWASVATSADGTKLMAGTGFREPGSFYLSSDSGVTWTPVSSLNAAGIWTGMAISADGSVLVATDANGSDGNGGYAYISVDGGITWQQQTSLGLRYWSDWTDKSIGISADGQTIAITDPYGSNWNDWNGGYIYITRDAGATWQPQSALGGKQRPSIAVSADGMHIATAEYRGYIHLGEMEGAATDTFILSGLPSSAPAAISQSALSVNSDTCYTINESSVEALGNVGVTSPEANVSIIGGLAFDVTCVTAGGSAGVTITLGAHYPDLSKVRVYKTAGPGALTDITGSITLSNPTVSGSTNTTITYTLADGGSLDEDGVANSTIVDPIYIGILGDAATSPTIANSGGALAATGTNLWALIGAAGAAIALAMVILVYYVIRQRPKGHL